jgi:hypothetical protein
MLNRTRATVLMVVLPSLGFVADAAAQLSSTYDIYALTDTPAEQILRFSSAPTGGGAILPLESASFITGLQPDEQLLRLRIGPAGTLYAVSSQNRLYTLTPGGLASPLLPFTPQLDGTAVGFAIDSADNTATIVTNLGQNFRIDLSGHLLSVGGSLTYAPGQVDPQGRPVSGNPFIEDVAYGPGPDAQLYGLDAHTNTLVRLVGAGDPSGGQVFTITVPDPNGNNGVGIASPLAFLDVLSNGDVVYTFPAVLQNEIAATLNVIDPNTGIPGQTLGYLGDIPVQLPLRAIAVPEPTSIGYLAGAIMLLTHRRR